MAGELPEDIKATLSILDSQTPPPPAQLKVTRTMEDIALPTKRQPAGGDDVLQTLAILDGKEPEPVATAGEPDPRDIEVDVLKLALRKGINSNTALAAHRQSVARKLNISPALVTPQAEESAFYQEHDPEDLHKNYPALAKYLKVEGNAELVGKNIEPMKELEVFFRRSVQDPEIMVAKGVVGAASAIVGLGNLVSAGKAGKYVEEHGIDLKKIQGVLNDLYTPETQKALEQVSRAEGFFGTIEAALKNPSSIGVFMVESLPQMYLGRVFGSGLKAVFPGLSFGAAGAAGEGITMAGGSAEQIRSATEDGELTAGQAALSVGVGVAGAAIGAVGAKLAKRLGIEDVDAALVAGKLLSRLEDAGVPKQLAVRLVGGAAIEGTVEEMPQSVVEQIAQNVALGRAWDEGVPESAAIGWVTGGAMGAAAQVGAVRGKPPIVTETPAEKQARTTVQNSILKTAAAVNAEEQRNAIKEWGQRVASNNPLRKEAPDSFKEFVRTMAEEDGALKEVYVDGKLLRESLAQAGIDEDKLKSTMPEVAESLGEALATDGEARIPIEDYAAHIVGTPVEQAILDHLRTTPEGMTYAEAQVYFQEQQDDFIKQAEALVSLNEPVLSRKEFEAQAPEGVKYKDYLAAHKNRVEVFAKDLETVHDKLLEGLDSTGRFPKSITRVYAIPFREFYATNAARMGVLPTELYDSLPLNFQQMSAGDMLDPRGLSQPEIERRLVAQHNISVEKLIHADRVGGLAAPSLAITDKEHSFDSFGEITLIADKSMVDPKKGAKAFAADIYSTRYPSVHYSFTEEKVNRLNKQLTPYRELTNSPEIGVRELNGESTEAKRALRENAAVMAAFLESKKIKPKLVKVKKTKLPRWAAKYAAESMHRYVDDPQFIKDVEKNLDDNSRERLKEYSAEERQRRLRNLAHAKAQEIDRYRVELPEQGKVSPSDTMRVMSEQMYAKGLQKEYGPYIQKLLHELNPEEKIFRGFSYSGARKYVPHTIEAAIAEIKKNLRGGEGSNFGPAVIRAAHTQQFRSIEQIKTAREALVSDADFERIKDEVEKEFFEVADELSKYYKHKRDIFYTHETAAMIDASTLGLQRALKENQFENVPKEVEDRVRDFLAKLYNLPTEYFEVKLLRAVSFGEFKGAVVPEGVAKEALEILRKNGVTDIKFYKPQDKADRLAKVNEFNSLFFQSANIPETITIDGTERPTRNSEGRLIHPTEEGIRNFWKWFSDSKVVDDQGRPKVLYHGTPDMSFDIFNPETYFSESGDIASIYTDTSASSIATKPKQSNAPGVYPVYVKMINPFDTRKTKQRDEFNNEYYLKYGTGTPLMDSGLPDWNDARDLSEWISESGKNYDGLLLDEGGLPQTDGSVKSRGISYAPLKGGNAIQSAIGNTGEFSEDPNILKQSAFYSALQREIPSISKIADKNGMVKTDQAIAWIEARQKEGKFKLEEVEAVGLKDWLQATEGKVSVADIENFVRENGVQIEETLLGGTVLPIAVQEDEDQPEIYTLYRADDPDGAYYGMLGEIIQTEKGEYEINVPDFTGKIHYPTLQEALERVGRGSKQFSETKFESYVLPGGTNYRELLLTLPDTKMQQQIAMNADYSSLSDSVKERLKGHAGFNLYDARDQGKLTPEEAARLTEIDADAARIRGLPEPFKSAHFDQPNILAHVRVDERTVGDQRVLFVEEIQSDWAQQGRDKGFQQNRKMPQGTGVLGDVLSAFGDTEDAGKIPTGPFVQNTKSWTALAVKRLLRYAAENGFDKIAWTTGEQQAARYDLSKQISEIRYSNGYLKAYDLDNKLVLNRSSVKEDELPDLIGKEAAQKLIDQPKEGPGQMQVLSGLDLKIGGEGMKAFYDQIVPQVVNEVSKKLGGGRVGSTNLSGQPKNRLRTLEGEDGKLRVFHENSNMYLKNPTTGVWTESEKRAATFDTYAEAQDAIAEHELPIPVDQVGEQHSLEITPEMRDKIMQGLPLFQGQRAGFDPSTFTISLLKGADLSSVIHEGAHFYLEALADLAGRDNAPQQIKDDFRTTLEWFGITGDEEGMPGGATLAQAPKLPDTINIDGIERPTRNSEGRPIYPTEEGIRNFWKWFGDSKVVDGQGRPLVVYHGTTYDNIHEFMPNGGDVGLSKETLNKFLNAVKNNTPFGLMNFRSGSFFSPDPKYAGNYTRENTGLIYPAYIKSVNPGYFQQDRNIEPRWSGFDADKTPDSLIFKEGNKVNEIAVIDPTQIKSAIGNNGDFSVSPNILEQGGETPPPGQLPPGRTPEEIWRSMTLDQKRPYHEQWAQSYERYTMEGKAPTVEMQSVFSRFREWMLSVYKSMKDFLAQNPLAGKLNDDIRAVFDRLIASEDKIYQAEEARGYSALFGSAAEAGLSEKEFEDYQNLGKLASLRAVDEMNGRSIRDMRWLSNAKDKAIKKLQAEANTKRAAVMSQVTDEVDAMPLNRARNFLAKGEFIDENGVRRESDTKFKLNTEEVKTLSNGQVPANLENMVAPDGIGLELAAKLLGYQNPEALLNDLVNGESRDVTIQGLTDQRMLEQYGDLTDDKAIELAAEKAIHNEARAKFMATGLKILAKTELSATQLNRAAKLAAEATIAKKKIRALTPGQFTRAEAKANREAIESVAKDPRKAVEAQRAALLNNRLAKAALEASEEVDSILKYFKKFESQGVRKAIGIDQIDQIDDLLQTVDRDKSLPLREIDKRQALAEWVAEQEADGFEPVLDPILAEQIKTKHYKDMTVDELRMLRDTVKQIEHVGRLKQTLLTEMRRADFRERVEEAEASIRDNANRTVKERGTPTDVAGITGQWVRQMIASHRKFSSYMREMDGGKDGGVMWRLLSKNMNAAGDREIEMRRVSGEAIAELFKGFKQEKAPLNLYAKRTQIPGTEIFMTQEQRIMFGMNWGNEGNRQRLLDGGITGKRALSITEAQAILDTLTKEEWDFIQGTWDHIATYRDQIAALERKLTGIEPEWIEPAETKTKYGTYRGGYFPAKYDVELSSRSESLEAAVDLRMGMKGAFNTAATRNGYTKQRSEAVMNRPLLLSYNVIANHISEVTHRLAWQPWLIDANRILKALDAPIREHYGAEVLRELRNTVIDIAAGDIGARTPMERAINHLRTGSTIVGMGWRFSTAFLQPSGLAQSWARIGGRWMAKGIAESLKNPNKAGEFVNARSSLMKNRDITMNREVREVLDRIRTTEGVNAVTGSYFSLIAKMQRMVDIPTWMGAYEKALHDLKYEAAMDAEQRARIENDAVALADQAVVDSQSGGQIKDLASIQRGHPGLKLFTNFYSYFSATYNLNIEALRRTNFRSPTDVAFLASDLVLLNVLPVIFAVALKEMTKGKCGDDLECLAASYGYEQMGFMFGQMVLLRDAGSAALVAAGGDQFGYSGPAGLRFFSDLYKAGVQANQGELDWPLFKSVSNTAGVLLHFPTGQINTTLEGIIAVENGDVDGVSILPALLFGPPKE